MNVNFLRKPGPEAQKPVNTHHKIINIKNVNFAGLLFPTPRINPGTIQLTLKKQSKMKKLMFVMAIASIGALASCSNSSSDKAAADSSAKMSADSSRMSADSSKMSADSSKMAADTTKKDTTTKK